MTVLDDMNKRAKDPLIGKPLGHVTIDRWMTDGETGTVYVGHHSVSKSEVAVRVLRTEMTAREGAAERLLYDIRVAMSINQPNVVRVIDCGESGHHVYVAMEFIKGEPLKALLAREGKLDPDRATRLIRDISRGLEAAHDLELVHRDIRPSNILLDTDGHPKINNFGLSRPASTGSGRTQIGDFTGPPHYLAPEQVAGEAVDARADQYALGVMYFEMLTGELPFAGVNDADIAKARLRGGIPSVAGLAMPVTSILLRLCARDPKERFADMRELAGQCERALYKRDDEPAAEKKREEPRDRKATWSRPRDAVKAEPPPPVGAVMANRAKPGRRDERHGLTALPTMSWAPPPRLARAYVAYGLAVACTVAAVAIRGADPMVRAGLMTGALFPLAVMVVLIVKQRTRWKGALALVFFAAALGAIFYAGPQVAKTRFNAMALGATLLIAVFIVSLPEFKSGIVRRIAIAAAFALVGYGAGISGSVLQWVQKAPVAALGAGAVATLTVFSALFLVASPRAAKGLRFAGFVCAQAAVVAIIYVATSGKPQPLVSTVEAQAAAQGTLALASIVLASCGHALLRSLP